MESERTAFRVGQKGENKFTKKQGIHLASGGLEGWHARLPEKERHAHLNKAVRRHGYVATIRSLTIIGNLNENESPMTTKRVREDVAWLQKTHGPSERGY